MLSGLTTRGWCLLAAGFAAVGCAAVLNERDLLRIAVFVIALPLVAMLLGARAKVRLVAERQLDNVRVGVGTTSTVQLALSGAGRMPLSGLLLEDGVPDSLGTRPRFVLNRISKGVNSQLSYPIRPTLRGIRYLGPLSVKVSDPFGLTEFDKKLAGESKIIVTPAVVPLVGLPDTISTIFNNASSLRPRSGRSEHDASLRTYRHGDDMRKVHWRTSARRDELFVRTEEQSSYGGATVLVDNRLSAHRGNGVGSSLEWAISCAASVCLHLHRNGVAVQLITEDGTSLVGGITHDDDVVLDALAGLEPAERQTLAGNYVQSYGSNYRIRELETFAILGAVASTCAYKLIGSLRTGSVVLLDVPAWDFTRRSSVGQEPDQQGESNTNGVAQLFAAAGWKVAIARPNRPIAQVWAQLCERGD